MKNRFILKPVSLSLATVMLFMCIFVPASASSTVNLLRSESVVNIKPIIKSIASGTVCEHSQFDRKGAISALNDGDKSALADVYGANDWGNYSGALITLDRVYYCVALTVTAGTALYADYYDIYASDDISTLYDDSNRIAYNLKTNGAEITVRVDKAVRFAAIFLKDFELSNGRIAELEIFGYESEPEAPTVSSCLYTNGNKLINENGDTVLLKGVNITEYSWSVYGDGSTQSGKSDADISVDLAIDDWYCNCIRLAVSVDYYLYGATTQNVTYTAEQYRDTIDKVIKRATDNGVAVILDCHGYSGVTDDVLSFWHIAAPKYSDNGLVLYGLLNEPISSWEVYYEGGGVVLPNGENKSSCGMTALLDLVRGYADNIVVIGGVDWAFDLSRITLSDFASFAEVRASEINKTKDEYISTYYLNTEARTGNGIIYDCHAYSKKNMNWDYFIGNCIQEYPVIFGEFGPEGLPYKLKGEDGESYYLSSEEEKYYLTKVFTFIKENGLHFTAWGMNAAPFLTKPDGTVTTFGSAVKEFIQTGDYNNKTPVNLLYRSFEGYRPVVLTQNGIKYWNTILSTNRGSGGELLPYYIFDGDSNTHYDLYDNGSDLMGIQYTLNKTFALDSITLSSGFSDYPDNYIIYASDKLSELYNEESKTENGNTVFSGTPITINVDRQIRYIAIFAIGESRIKELTLNGGNIGDIDSDGFLASNDLICLKKMLLQLNQYSFARCDVNSDGTVNIIDLIYFKKKSLCQ